MKLHKLSSKGPQTTPTVGETYTNPNGMTRTVLEIVGDMVIFNHKDPSRTKATIGSCRVVNWGRWLRGEKLR